MIDEFISHNDKCFKVKEAYKGLWTVHHLSKGTIIHERGSVSYKTFIVLKGIARSFVYKNGKEITTYFAIDGMPILGIDAFKIPKVQSEYTIELLDDSIIAEAPLDKFHQALEDQPGLCTKYLNALEKEYMELAMMQITTRFTTAKDRYLDFSLKYPQIMQKVKLTYIASFLDISLETLSRGRTRWDKEKLIQAN
ncbi:MAG: Crp/Fnr family transcriptional regulator [Carboxylicivirga sp.]|jgi:CRP-like cAMP-binding protein|nr:Crp/Fnr family transcriptional regulator [Carboxylicivirga sp.]